MRTKYNIGDEVQWSNGRCGTIIAVRRYLRSRKSGRKYTYRYRIASLGFSEALLIPPEYFKLKSFYDSPHYFQD